MKMTCPKCNRASRIPVNTDNVGQMHQGFCPLCGVPIRLPITEELVKKLEAAMQQKGGGESKDKGKDETYVPNNRSGSGHSGFAKDDTYVPGMNNVKSRSLVLTTVASDFTQLEKYTCDQQFMVVGKKNAAGPLHRPDVEVVTQDPYMSKKHFLIKKMSEKDFAIEDYNSTNGTWLNGKKLEQGESLYLEEGDKVRAGRTEFVVSFKNLD